MSVDLIRVEGLEVQCIVGIFPEERTRLQPLRLTVELEIDATSAATSCDLEQSFDYSRIGPELGFLLKAGAFRLLETAALALCRHLLTPSAPPAPRLAAASVTVVKPEALGGAGVPSLHMRRTADQVRVRREAFGEACLDRIFECPDAGIYRLQRWQERLPVPGGGRYRTFQELALGPETVLRVALP